ncbi:hypothetical protein CBM2595_A80008 [Cupriavidus taiwanensis]|nr:hypothetical protein CBM2595_A80008 [Cupriavidus taiwanensis]
MLSHAANASNINTNRIRFIALPFGHTV